MSDVPFADTIGNPQWLKANESELKAMLPEEWTEIGKFPMMPMAFKLKLLGVDWRSFDEFGAIMVCLTRAGIVLRHGRMVKRNPRRVFADHSPSLN